MSEDNLEIYPFDFKVSRVRKVLIYRQGKLIKTLTGKESVKLINRMDGKDKNKIQLALAKATGNYKRGNEKNIS